MVPHTESQGVGRKCHHSDSDDILVRVYEDAGERGWWLVMDLHSFRGKENKKISTSKA